VCGTAGVGEGGTLPLVAGKGTPPRTQILNMYLQPPQEELVYKVRFFNDPTL
jgi:hypothetical protein